MVSVLAAQRVRAIKTEGGRKNLENQYAIEMLNITKKFPGIIANDNITLQLKKGEIHALLGENGAGKSTLMSVLFGLYQPEEGIIKGVFTFDYTKEGDDICIHSFTLSYETAEGITIRNPEVYAVDLVRTPVVDNQISLKHLRILSRKPSSNIFFSGSFDYKGEEHSFQIDL